MTTAKAFLGTIASIGGISAAYIIFNLFVGVLVYRLIHPSNHSLYSVDMTRINVYPSNGLIQSHIVNLFHDNKNEIWQTKPLSSQLGVELIGIQKHIDDFSPADIQNVKSLLWEHKIVKMKLEYNISCGEQLAFSKKFSEKPDEPLSIHLESASRHDDFPEVTVISNIANAKKKSIGLNGSNVEHYHSDLSWSDKPGVLTMLYSIIQPSDCGNTVFIDSQAAYESLPKSLQEQLQPRVGKHCYLKFKGNKDRLQEKEFRDVVDCSIHPIIATHPNTKKPYIFANPTDTELISDIDKRFSESNQGEKHSNHLLEQVFKHIESTPAFAYQWQPGDLLIWDNRGLQHRGTGCPSNKERLLYRTITL